jgi:hypothetical protein
MPHLHLLNQEGAEFPQPGPTDSGEMESGWWLVSMNRAESVIGHPIHFHRRKAETAFLSGIVTGYRRETYTPPEGRPSTRTVFLFTEVDSTGTATTTDGWTPAGVKYVP